MHEQNQNAPPRLLRLPKVLERTGLGRTMIYTLAKRGEFPAPIKLTSRSSAWSEAAVNAWIEARIAEAEGDSA